MLRMLRNIVILEKNVPDNKKPAQWVAAGSKPALRLAIISKNKQGRSRVLAQT
jgi:hypothetical protein